MCRPIDRAGNVQTLLKKHKEVTEELKNYQATIDALHEQASALGDEDRQSGPVLERLASIDRRYIHANSQSIRFYPKLLLKCYCHFTFFLWI
jgi:hypothetical protein